MKLRVIRITTNSLVTGSDLLVVLLFFGRYYHDNRNFTRLLTMLSNEVVARARQLVGEHVLENLLAVSNYSCLLFIYYFRNRLL